MFRPTLNLLMADELGEFDKDKPSDLESFLVQVECLIGTEDSIAADLFYFTVLTLDRLLSLMGDVPALSGRRYLFMKKWDPDLIRSTVEQWVSKAVAPDWDRSAAILCRYMKWEYEDHPDID